MNIGTAGIITAVCMSPKEGVPKYPQKEAVIAQYGLKGDYHCKPTRRSFSKPDTEKPNTDRHITIVGYEALLAVSKKLTLDLQHGDLGENISTFGLGDLSDIWPYTVIRIGNEIKLRVVKQNKPCKNLIPYHPHFIKEIHRRRGLLCSVQSGINNVIKPDDIIACFPPDCDWCGNWMSKSVNIWLCRSCHNTIKF